MNDKPVTMMTEPHREELKDDAGLRELYMTAHLVLQRIGKGKWYDTGFLIRYNASRDFLGIVRPEAVARFEALFDPLRTRADYRIAQFERLFSDEIVSRVKEAVASLPKATLEKHERNFFGRDTLHNHALFTQLQVSLVPLVSDVAGEPVEPGYNFLSLYGGDGRCGMHMDEPIAKWTLDYCIDQSCEWPIHFSQVIDWPSSSCIANFDAVAVKTDPRLEFETHTLLPNNALLFAGSGQWHYRDSIPDSGFCNLLFFHYHPAGAQLLTNAGNWPDLLDLPELKVLLDMSNTVHNTNRHE